MMKVSSTHGNRLFPPISLDLPRGIDPRVETVQRRDSLSSSLFTCVGSETLPVVPGAANTREKVLDLYRRYPWIWTDIDSFDGQGEELLRMIEQIWIHDRKVFHQAVREPRARKIDPNMNPRDQVDLKTLANEIPPTKLRRLTQDFVTVLRDHHFGTGKLLIVVLKSKYHTKSLTQEEYNNLFRELDRIGLFLKPHKAELWVYFLARATYPERFGFRALTPRPAITRSVFDRFESTVKVTRRPESLPENINEYGSRGDGIWLRLDRFLESMILEDPETLQRFFQRARTFYPSQWQLPVELTLIDPTSDQIALVINKLLEQFWTEERGDKVLETRPVFGGDRIRLVIGTSKGQTQNSWRKIAILEYRVEVVPAHPLRREALLMNAKPAFKG